MSSAVTHRTGGGLQFSEICGIIGIRKEKDGEKLTEGEFQDFLVTVGYRYNKKTMAAFHTFEGFQTILDFNTKEKKYIFLLSTGVKDSGTLLNELCRFKKDNKECTLAQYGDKRIKIKLRITVDSEIDKENLKEAIKFINELQKSELIFPICRVCSRNRKTGLYVVGQELVPMCDRCLARKQRQYERRRDMYEKKKQNMPAGLVGAGFGAALGAVLYILLYQFFNAMGITAALISLGGFAGFVAVGRRATRKSAVICMIGFGVVFLAAEYLSLVASMAVLIEGMGGGIAVSESISATNMSFFDQSYLSTVIMEIIVGMVSMAVVGVGYYIKRALTRPLKISKNVL